MLKRFFQAIPSTSGESNAGAVWNATPPCIAGVSGSWRSHATHQVLGAGGGRVWRVEVARVLCLTAEPTPLAFLGQVVIKADFKMTVLGLVTGRRGLSSYHDLSSVLLDLECALTPGLRTAHPSIGGHHSASHVLSKVTGPPRATRLQLTGRTSPESCPKQKGGFLAQSMAGTPETLTKG